MTRRRDRSRTEDADRRRLERQGEPAVVRSGEEQPSAVDRWRQLSRPRNRILQRFADGFSEELVGSMDDAAFLVMMRNRLLSMKSPASTAWPWLRRLFGRREVTTRMAGFEIKRLLRMAGQPPPEGLDDRGYAPVSYGQLQRMVAAAEAATGGAGDPA